MPSPKITGRSRSSSLPAKIATTPASPCGSWRGPYTFGERERGVLEPAHLPVVVEVVADRLLRDAVRRLRALRLRPRGSGSPRACRTACRPSRRTRPCWHPAATAPSQTLSDPRMFTVASNTGRATDTRTSICAARWKMTSGRRCVDRGRRPRATRRRGGGTRSAGRAGPRASARLRERAAREVVDDVDLPALGEQAVDERRADEPGAAGHQRLHGSRRRTLLALGGNPPARDPCPGRDGHAGADDRVVAAAPPRASATASPPTTEWSTVLPCETRAPSCSTAHSSTRARLDDRTRAEHRPCTRAPDCDARAVADEHGRLDARTGLDRRVALHPDARLDLTRPASGGRPTRPASTSSVRLRGTSRASRCRASTRRCGSRRAVPAARACAGTSRARPTR